MKRLALGTLLIAALAATAAHGLSVSMVSLEPGLLLIGNTDETSTGMTPFVVTQSVGVSIPLALSGPYFLEPAAILYGTWYEYTGTRAVPAASESASSFFVLGALLAVRAGAAFSVSPKVALGASAGLDLAARFPIDFGSGADARADDRRASWAYLYGRARFLYPETSLFCRWSLTEKFGLLFTARALHPVFLLWDGESLPYIDQMIIVGQVGFTWSLP